MKLVTTNSSCSKSVSYTHLDVYKRQEQYAIQTGQHPAITTVNNINRYREQLDKIGFSFDWNREIRTCEPE